MRAVQAVEQQMLDNRPQRHGYGAPSQWRWFELTGEMDTDTYTVEGKIIEWRASANSGDGELQVTEDTYNVRDTTFGKWNVGEGDWVFCRPIGSNNYTVWEIVATASSAYDRCTALAYGAISGSTGTVDNVAPIRGANPTEETTDTMLVYNPHSYEVDDNAMVRIEWNKTTEHWEIYQATCPA